MRKSALERVIQSLNVSLEEMISHSSLRSLPKPRLSDAKASGNEVSGADLHASRSHSTLQNRDLSSFGPSVI
jgi:hypothetical protein